MFPPPLDQASDRAIRLLNFRDIGGVKCEVGRRVRRGRLFRSATPDFATPSDVALLERFGVRTVLDLRTSPERVYLEPQAQNNPEVASNWTTRTPLKNFCIHNVPMLTELWDPGMLASTTLRPERFLADRYLEMCEFGADMVAACFRTLADHRTTPVLVHCTAGKDRTGVLVALLLSSLGVSDESIADDYSLSALAMPELVALIRDNTPERIDAMVNQPAAFLSSPVEAMLIFLTELRNRYGSVIGYLHQAGVDDASLDILADHLTTLR